MLIEVGFGGLDEHALIAADRDGQSPPAYIQPRCGVQFMLLIFE